MWILPLSTNKDKKEIHISYDSAPPCVCEWRQWETEVYKQVICFTVQFFKE